MSDVPTPVSTALALPLATPAECGAMVVHARGRARAGGGPRVNFSA